MFQYLAQEAVHSCILSLLHASRLISQANLSSAPPSTLPASSAAVSLDGLLFLIKHLLILREQILPFKVEFVTTEQKLDFSHIPNTLPSLFNRAGFSRGISNFLALVQQSEPKLTSHKTDSKKDMAQELTRACEQLIRSQTHLLMHRLLAFLHKHQQHTQTPTVAPTAAGTAAAASSTAVSPDAAPIGVTPAEAEQMKTELALILTSLRTAAVLQTDNTANGKFAPSLMHNRSHPVSTVVSLSVLGCVDASSSAPVPSTSATSLEVQLRSIRSKLALYLRNPMHENILFKPIKVRSVGNLNLQVGV